MRVGRVAEIVRYPVKSMAGVAMDTAVLGWHGLPGDRRFAFRRKGVLFGMPWLSASRLPELLLYRPVDFDDSSGEPLPTHVLTPAGARLPLRSAELREELTARCGKKLELVNANAGVFDDGTVSVITRATIAGIGREAGLELDRRRFRANFVVESEQGEPFHEDAWVGGTLLFGDRDTGPAVSVTVRDVRCMMINLDPDTAEQHPGILKAVVRLNRKNAGVYATVARCGAVRAGDPLHLVPAAREAGGT